MASSSFDFQPESVVGQFYGFARLNGLSGIQAGWPVVVCGALVLGSIAIIALASLRRRKTKRLTACSLCVGNLAFWILVGLGMLAYCASVAVAATSSLPPVLSVGTATIVPAAALGVAAWYLLQAEGFSGRATVRCCNASVRLSSLAIAVCVCLLVVYELCIVLSATVQLNPAYASLFASSHTHPWALNVSRIANGTAAGLGANAYALGPYQYKYSYVATSWIFLSWNQILLVLCLSNFAYLSPKLHSAMAMLQPKALVALALQWRKARLAASAAGRPVQPSDLPEGSLLELFLVGTRPDGRSIQRRTWPAMAFITRMEEDAVADGGFTCVQTYWPFSPSALLFVSAQLVLAGYMLVNWHLAAPSAPGLASVSSAPPSLSGANLPWDGAQGRYLGFTTSGGVVLITLTLNYMMGAGLVRSFASACVATSLARVALLAYGARYWLLGISTVYAVIGVYLAHMAVAQFFAIHGQFGVQAPRGALGSSVAISPSSSLGTQQAVTRGVQTCAAVPSAVASALRAVFLSPFGVVTIVTCCFGALIAGLGWAMTQDTYDWIFPSGPVPVTDTRAVPQSTFAVGALVIVVQVLLISFCYRLYKRGRRSWSTLGAVLVALACAISAGAAVGLWYELRSIYILAVGVFYPPVIAVTCAMYGQWVRDDFAAWLGSGLDIRCMLCCRRGGRGEDGTGEAGASWTRAVWNGLLGLLQPRLFLSSLLGLLLSFIPSGRNAFERWASFKASCARLFVSLTARNAVMAYGALFVTLCHVAIGVLIGYNTAPRWAGLGIAGGLYSLQLASSAAVQYRNTQEIRPYQAVAGALAFLVYTSIHVVVWSTYRHEGASSFTDVAGVAFSYILWLSLAALALCVYLLSDNSWRFTRTTMRLAVAANVTVTAFLAASIALFRPHIESPAALLALWVVANAALFTALAHLRARKLVIATTKGATAAEDAASAASSNVMLATLRSAAAKAAVITRHMRSVLTPPVPAWLQLSPKLFAAVIIVGGIAFACWEYLVQGRADRAALWLSVALWSCVALLVLLAHAHLQSAGVVSVLSSPSNGGRPTAQGLSLLLSHPSRATSSSGVSLGSSTPTAAATAAHAVALPVAVANERSAALEHYAGMLKSASEDGAGVARLLNDAGEIASSASSLSTSILAVSGLTSVGSAASGRTGTSRATLVLSSPCILPAYALPSLPGAQPRRVDRAFVLLTFAFGLAALWSVLAVIFIYPPYVGVMVLCVLKVAAAIVYAALCDSAQSQWLGALSSLALTAVVSGPPPLAADLATPAHGGGGGAKGQGRAQQEAAGKDGDAQLWTAKARVLDAVADAVTMAVRHTYGFEAGQGAPVNTTGSTSATGLAPYSESFNALFPSFSVHSRAQRLYGQAFYNALQGVQQASPAARTLLLFAASFGCVKVKGSSGPSIDAHIKGPGMGEGKGLAGTGGGGTAIVVVTGAGGGDAGSNGQGPDAAKQQQVELRERLSEEQLRALLADSEGRLAFVRGQKPLQLLSNGSMGAETGSSAGTAQVSSGLSLQLLVSRAAQAADSCVASLHDGLPVSDRDEEVGSLLEVYASMQAAAAALALEEHTLLSRVQQHVIAAGAAAQAVTVGQWASFLGWCALPRQSSLVQALAATSAHTAALADIQRYGPLLTASQPESVADSGGDGAAPSSSSATGGLDSAGGSGGGDSASPNGTTSWILGPPPRAALASRTDLLAFWTRTLGVHAAQELAVALGLLSQAYALFQSAVRGEQERRKQEEEEAAERRRQEDARRRQQAEAQATAAAAAAQAEAARKAQEEEAAVRERQAALARQAREEEDSRRAAEETAAAAAAARLRAEEAMRAERAAKEQEERRRAEAARRRADAEAAAAAARAAVAEAAQKAAQAAAEAERARQAAAAAEKQRQAAEAAARAAAEAQQRASAPSAAGSGHHGGAEGAGDTRALTSTAGGQGNLGETGVTLQQVAATVASLSSSVRSGSGGAVSVAGKWTDLEFSGPTAFGTGNESKQFNKVGWARAEDLAMVKKGGDAASAVRVVHEGYNPNDLAQGMLGDCWLLSAFSVLASRPEYLDQVLCTREYNPAGVYGVRLWKGGQWREVVLDDQLPVYTDRYITAETGDGPFSGVPDKTKGRVAIPAFVGPKVHGPGACLEIWPMLLEKAWARYYGSYAALDGGLVNEGLCGLVPGSVGSRLDLTSQDTQAKARTGELFEQLRRYVEYGYLLGAGSPSGSDTDISPSGIVQGHAYSLLRVDTVSDADATHKLVQLRNPWGKTEWKGAWSDSDKGRWRARVKSLLGYDPATSQDDGLFWMRFSDFTAHFASVYVCRVFKLVGAPTLPSSIPSVPVPMWYKYVARGAWKGKSAGGCSNYSSTAQFNPQFYLAPTQPCSLYISLVQSDDVAYGGRQEYTAIGFAVLKKEGTRVGAWYTDDIVQKSGYVNSQEVGLELDLAPTPSGQPYTLFVSTFEPKVEKSFLLTVYSTAPLSPGFGGPDGMGQGGGGVARSFRSTPRVQHSEPWLLPAESAEAHGKLVQIPDTVPAK